MKLINTQYAFESRVLNFSHIPIRMLEKLGPYYCKGFFGGLSICYKILLELLAVAVASSNKMEPPGRSVAIFFVVPSSQETSFSPPSMVCIAVIFYT